MEKDETSGLLKFMLETPGMLERVFRWSNYASVPAAERETVLEHSFNSVVLAGAMLSIEERGRLAGRFNHSRLLLCALLHDLGEGRIGDVTFHVKNDPRIKAGLHEIEQEQVRALLAPLPEAVRTDFLDALTIEGDGSSLEGRFFNAVEQVGYVFYAFHQAKRLGRGEFKKVLLNHHATLVKHAEEFTSVRVLYMGGPILEYTNMILNTEAQEG